MSNIRNARHALTARLIEDDGRASRAHRQGAFVNGDLGEPLNALVRKVVQNAHAVTDQDVANVGAAGLEEDQTFEIVICAAVGEASRQYDAALASLEAAVRER
jgi:hypothetical protein